MFQSPDYDRTLSIKLSEVMEDIGVNEEMVMRRRRVNMLMESIDTVTYRSFGMNITFYHLGSQSEGTTTKGLDSDMDILFVHNDFNVMQDWSEWKQNKINYLMIQDENVTPGYCFLQRVRKDVPLPDTNIPNDDNISDGSGRILLKNTVVTSFGEFAERQGPSNAISGVDGCYDTDLVWAFPCNSWPQSASNFQERQRMVRWPSSEIFRYAASCGCFVVGASSKISTHPDLEWRISTSLAERCMMFNLNITQLQCYVLMKMILKYFLNPRKENGMSSFMCKTVLLRCIENTEQNTWVKDNLSTCLTYCFLELHNCVQNDNCPHFFILENNLMAGQFTIEGKNDLLKRIGDFIQSNGRYLLRINIDDISHRLQVKLNTFSDLVPNFMPPFEIKRQWSRMLYIDLSNYIDFAKLLFLNNFSIENLKQIPSYLINYSLSGNRFEQLFSRYMISFLCSNLGLAQASSCIGRNNPVNRRALMLLSYGLNSDVTSGRLKLASVFYCTGDMYRAELVLRRTEREYDTDNVVPICSCCWHAPPLVSLEFDRKCIERSEEYYIKTMASFCVKFMPIELNCVPRELQYEMHRSTRDDMPYRSALDRKWMDFAVVDSLPLLYFLQYKTYGYLQRYQDQQHALNKILMSIVTVHGFGHRETALNLLGQCMEQENRHREALHYYMLSLKLRARNNAAKIHICCLLAKFVRTNAM